MTSKATNQRDLTDVIKKQKRDGKKAAGIIRAQASGISGADTAITSGQKTSAGGAGGSPVTQDLQMNTFDIRDVDRLYFSTTAGSADALTANDTGIESASYYDGTNYYSLGMNYRIPSPAAGMGHYFLIGSEQCLTVKNDKIEVKKPLRLTTGTATGSYLSGSMYYDGTDIQAVVPAGTVNLTSGGAGAGLGDNNVWTGTNTFQNVVTMTGSAVTIGDASTDILNILSGLGSSINVNTHDLQNIDRALFSTTGTDNVGSSDMGIGTNSNDSDYLTYNVPSGYQRFKVGGTLAMSVGPTTNPGVTIENQLYVNGALTSTGNTVFNGNVDIGNSSGDSLTISSTLDAQLRMGNNKITSLGTPSTDYDAATKKYVDDNAGSGGGASTTLNNLGTTAINASLIPASNLGISLGSSSKSFNAAYILQTVGLQSIGMSTTGQSISSSGGGLQYNVPSSDTHIFGVNSGNQLQIGETVTYSGNSFTPALDSTYALGASSLRWSGLWSSGADIDGIVTITGSVVCQGNVNLGNATTDIISLNGGVKIGSGTNNTIGFFGTTPIPQLPVSTSASLYTVIYALRAYGLFS
jgi:hypothetical protein|tara:strand:- start:46 stop:1785 length:1740 start_codon:yes stop_codon:yes gene_type:complete